MSPVTSTRRRMPRAERTAQIVQMAEQVLAERGYQAMTMDHVAELAGITKPVIYDYFGSKEGLLLACLGHVRAELLEATQQAVAGVSDLEQMLRRGLVAFFEFIDEHGKAWQVLLHEAVALSGRAAEEIEALRRQQTAFMAAIMAGAQPGGDARQFEAYAQAITGACERLALWRQTQPGGSAGVPPERAAAYLMDIFWHGLRP